MKATEGPDSPIDGRRARGQANRSKLVAAMIELVREGTIAPTAEQVALRARVALRTVFRHFDDMESLYREINTEILQQIIPLLSTPFAASDWRGRLEEAVDRRARLYETILPFYTATTALRHQSPYLQANQQSMMELQKASLLRVLPQSVIEDQATLAALNLLLSVTAWYQMRQEQGLDLATARQAILVASRALTASFKD
ncbi:transcriptional regulator, TetR family [Pseudomonas pohangensis]|uniref:Transcriptional regulator, TetR family n=1 Tax=Pseudomonas pohangensis TaxID=364197 RepID=A0A1H2GH56_9PSED|nr:TetR/AcrR family transcriptional regulator [Pseudomonas pohangensis]SDU18829.1 transcriptional regulator, TetR family [Pseudomonas pohangensis]